MSGRKPLLENDEPLVREALSEFPLRDQALITLGLNTGFRISELLSFTVGQVWEAGRVKSLVKVTRAKLKGGHGCRRNAVSSRSVPLNAAVAAVLEPYLFARFGSGLPDGASALPLFASRHAGRALSRWQANRIVHAVFEKAGLGSPECYGTHSLRKTFCRRVYTATKYDINLTRAVMTASALAKLAGAKPIVENLTKVGIIPYFPLPGLALVELLCVVAFLTPRTSRIGFFLMCGYLGGAGSIDFALHMPPIGLVLLTIIWIGAYLKDKTLFFSGSTKETRHEQHLSGFSRGPSLLTESAPPVGLPGSL